MNNATSCNFLHYPSLLPVMQTGTLQTISVLSGKPQSRKACVRKGGHEAGSAQSPLPPASG